MDNEETMTPETFTVEFWRPGIKDYCPRQLIAAAFSYDEAAQVCASLKARGYRVQVYELKKVETPT